MYGSCPKISNFLRFYTAFDSVKYTDLGKDYLRNVFSSDSMYSLWWALHLHSVY